MSHKPLPYTPNFPPNQGYGPPAEEKPNQNYPIYPNSSPVPVGYPVPPPGPNLVPQPLGIVGGPSVQPPYNPGFQPAYQHGYSGPIVQQPVPQVPPGGWMTIPQGLSNCPPGLEYLSLIDKLIVHQKIELAEAFLGFETNNKYIVMNSLGQNVYKAVEDNDCCTRMCCGSWRPFEMKIKDNFDNEVIHLHRPLACDSCCCPCWLQSMEVTAPPGIVIGSVEQEWTLFKPSYVIKNERGDIVLRIKGPCCHFSLCGDVKFNVYSSDGETKVGKITKHWSGLAREIFTDSDNFGISFPMDLDVRVKAVLLGACFLIDFMFFERAGNQERSRPGML